jgi:predicted phage terminase large subunit-like protein
MAGERTLIIPAIHEDEDGEEHSTWPAKFSLHHLRRIRAGNPIAFESQYQQNTKPMKSGGLIKFDQINRFDPGDLPADLPMFLGVDLAIGEKKKHDKFWALVGAFDQKTGNVYALHAVRGRFGFAEQRAIIIKLAKEFDIVRGVVEAIAYQAAMIGDLKREDPLLPLVGYKPKVDKRTRMERRTPLFESGQVYVARGLDDLVKQLVEFTGEKGREDDAADAWLFMVRSIQVKKKKPRKDFGLF